MGDAARQVLKESNVVGLANVIALNHPPRESDGPKLIHQFTSSGSAGFYPVDAEDNLDVRPTSADILSIESYRRADQSLGHLAQHPDEIAQLHIDNTAFVEGGVNHHVHGYSVKETGFEQNSSAADNTDGDPNIVTGTGRLKMGIQDDAYGRAERKKSERAYIRLSQQEILRQQLADLNERIAKLEKKIVQIDDNISKLKEAREILAHNALNDDTEEGQALRARLNTINSGLQGQGVDLGVQTDSSGKIVNADEASSNAVRAQDQQEIERDQAIQDIRETQEKINQIKRDNPDLDNSSSVTYSGAVSKARTAEETAALESRVAEIRAQTENDGVFAASEPAQNSSVVLVGASDDPIPAIVEPAPMMAMLEANTSSDDLFGGFPVFEAPTHMFADNQASEAVQPLVSGQRSYGSYAGSEDNSSVITAKFAAVAPNVTPTTIAPQAGSLDIAHAEMPLDGSQPQEQDPPKTLATMAV